MSLDVRKPVFGFTSRSDINRVAPLLNMARGLKLWIYEVEGLYYLCSENKDADQLPRSWSASLFFAHAKIRFSHIAVNIWFGRGEQSSLVVEPLTSEQKVGGTIPTQGAVLCPWARHYYSKKSTFNGCLCQTWLKTLMLDFFVTQLILKWLDLIPNSKEMHLNKTVNTGVP